MPKRPPTPEPGDDEPKYFTVVNPYPAHANMELIKDRKDFAFWLACIVGKEDVQAFFHRKISPSTVIVEIAKRSTADSRLLGQHNWSEFLRNPDETDKQRSSKIFYCVYNTGRKVQKHGWKRIWVEEGWFKETGWKPKNKVIQYPYPQSHYCKAPIQDPTNHELCRPLPVAYFPPPELPPAPKPGSEAWLKAREEEAGLASKPVVRVPGGAWARGAPPPPAARGGHGGRGGRPTPAASSARPTATSPSVRAPSVAPPRASSSAWQSLSGSSPAASGPPSSAAPAEPAPAPEPATWDTINAGPAVSDWAEDFDDEVIPPDTPPPHPSTQPIPIPADDYGEDELPPGVPLVPPGLTRRPPPVPADDDDDDDLPLGAEAGYVTSQQAAIEHDFGKIDLAEDADAAGDAHEEETNLWEDWGEPAETPLLPSQWDCPEHGRTCKRGICKAWAQKKREEKREAERREREEAIKARTKARAKGRGEGRGGTRGGRGGGREGFKSTAEIIAGNKASEAARSHSGESVVTSGSSGSPDEHASETGESSASTATSVSTQAYAKPTSAWGKKSAAPPVAASRSTTGGWDAGSNGPWDGTQRGSDIKTPPATASQNFDDGWDAPVVDADAWGPSPQESGRGSQGGRAASVADSNAWGSVSTTPWDAKAQNDRAPPVPTARPGGWGPSPQETRRGPQSVADSNAWGSVSTTPWDAKSQNGRAPPVPTAFPGGWGASPQEVRRGPQSVADSNAWGSISTTPWDAKSQNGGAPSVPPASPGAWDTVPKPRGRGRGRARGRGR